MECVLRSLSVNVLKHACESRDFHLTDNSHPAATSASQEQVNNRLIDDSVL